MDHSKYTLNLALQKARSCAEEVKDPRQKCMLALVLCNFKLNQENVPATMVPLSSMLSESKLLCIKIPDYKDWGW
jgi:hypothetical protein